VQMTLIPNVGEKEIHMCANDIDSKCWGKRRFTYVQMTLIPNVWEKEIHICANDIDSECSIVKFVPSSWEIKF